MNNKTFKEFSNYHYEIEFAPDLSAASAAEYQSAQSSKTISETIETASPGLLIWIATSIGVAPPEKMRMFALWSASQLNAFVTDRSCKQALSICEEYLNDPYPEILTSDIDVLHILRDELENDIYRPDLVSPKIREIFYIVERQYSQWYKPTATDDKVCGAVHSAIWTMSEAHCKETGFNKRSNRWGPANRKIAPAVSAHDDLTVGMHWNARLAAECSINAIGEAAADSFNGQPEEGEEDYYDDDYEKDAASEKARDDAQKAQADWLRENISLTFD